MFTETTTTATSEAQPMPDDLIVFTVTAPEDVFSGEFIRSMQISLSRDASIGACFQAVTALLRGLSFTDKTIAAGMEDWLADHFPEGTDA